MSSLERARRAWVGEYDGLSPEERGRRMSGFAAMVRAVFEEGVVTPERFAALMGVDATSARKVLGELSSAGMQTDESGNVTGAALSALETPHKMRFAEKTLYAWCALDTLFIPGLLGKRADVESTCPVSGEPIRLTVSPTLVEECEPSSARLSVFLPGGSSRQLGLASPT